MADEEGNEEIESKARVEDSGPTVEKTEAQLIIEAKQRKHEEEDAEKLRELEEQRRVEREKADEELRRLKEKQAQRQKQREEEERILAEQKIQQEEQRKQEEEARRLKTEEDKRKKLEEAERKKAAAQAAMTGGRNFVIEREKEGQGTIDKFMNISKAKTEMSLNAGELDALKKRTMMDRIQPLAVGNLDHAGLKNYAEELWKQIIQLETAKYDLNDRSTRQEYDLKELNERQRQINMKKYVAAGVDVDSAASRHPPKVQLISKYERRTDRRSFGERKDLFTWDPTKEQKKELIKPPVKKRDTWIKDKGADEPRHSFDYAEDEENRDPEEPNEATNEQATDERKESVAAGGEEAQEE